MRRAELAHPQGKSRAQQGGRGACWPRGGHGGVLTMLGAGQGADHAVGREAGRQTAVLPQSTVSSQLHPWCHVPGPAITWPTSINSQNPININGARPCRQRTQTLPSTCWGTVTVTRVSRACCNSESVLQAGLLHLEPWAPPCTLAALLPAPHTFARTWRIWI